MDIAEVGKVLRQISTTTKKTEKESIIASHKDDTLFGKVLNHIFNPYVKTNIAEKKIDKNVSGVKGFTPLENVEDYMNFLANSTGNDEQINSVQIFINSNDESIRWLLRALATKSLKIGATSSTINKAYKKNFIPCFDVMLAEKYIDTKTIKGKTKVYLNYERYEGKEVIVTKKLDGNRYAIFVRDDGSVKLYSREGHILDGCEEIEEAMSNFPRGYVYDGEILATNEEGLSSQELYTKTSKILRKKGVKKGVEFHAFDIIPIAEFEKGYWGVCCKHRKSGLKKLIEKMDKHLIKNVDTIYVGEYDFDEVERLAEVAKENKEEGIMVQLAEAPYQCKRTFDILKVKSFESADVRCLDVYEGKKESTKGKLGGVVLDFKGYRVNVGIGFSEQERIDLWRNPDQIIGQIVEIKYFEQFLQEDGTIDLRFASFKTIRTDKNEPSYH